MNERLTEDIIRSHFKADPLFSQIILEEQKSRNPRINKMLQSASRSVSGTGVGKPEFIISFPDLYDFVVVVECKADVRKHESPDRDRYLDYAIDGALLYAAHLSRQFDTLVIALSGVTEVETQISHSFWPKVQAGILQASLAPGNPFAIAVAQRTGIDPTQDLYPRLVTAAVAAATQVAIDAFLRSDPPVPLAPLLSDALELLADGLPDPLATRLQR